MKALVLGGGGSKGAYQAGIMEYLLGVEKNIYDIYCGISVGALNAAFVSQVEKGMPIVAAQRLRELWESVTTAKVHKGWFPFGILEALWKPSVYNSKPLWDWVRSELNISDIRNSGNLLRVLSTSWHTGETHVAHEDNLKIADWVLASSAFPVMLTPIQIDGDLWTDGGLRSVTPLGEAIRAGATEVDVVMCSDPFAASLFDLGGANAIPQLLLRAIDVMSDAVSRADLQIAGLKNDLAQLKPEYKNVKIRIWKPRSPLPFDSLDFSPENIKKMYALGLGDASIWESI